MYTFSVWDGIMAATTVGVFVYSILADWPTFSSALLASAVVFWFMVFMRSLREKE